MGVYLFRGNIFTGCMNTFGHQYMVNLIYLSITYIKTNLIPKTSVVRKKNIWQHYFNTCNINLMVLIYLGKKSLYIDELVLKFVTHWQLKFLVVSQILWKQWMEVRCGSGVMVSKLDLQTFTWEFKSHLVPSSCSLMPHLSKKLSKLQLFINISEFKRSLINKIRQFLFYYISKHIWNTSLL